MQKCQEEKTDKIKIKPIFTDNLQQKNKFNYFF